MAGFRFVQELLGLGAGFDITVVGDEPGGAYNRAQLPLVLARAAREDSIELADETWYAARGVRVVAGAARRINRAGLGLETARGLAAGGLPVTLVHRGSRLMERQLDAAAARILARTLRGLGVAVLA